MIQDIQGAPQSASTAGRPADGSGGDNIVDLLRELGGQGTHLADQQLSLIKAEVRESAADVKAAVDGMVGAAVVGVAGLGVVLMGLAYLPGDAINNVALATLIVGVAAIVLAYVLYRDASSKMSARYLAPDRTQRTLERTPDALRRDPQHVSLARSRAFVRGRLR